MCIRPDPSSASRVTVITYQMIWTMISALAVRFRLCKATSRSSAYHFLGTPKIGPFVGPSSVFPHSWFSMVRQTKKAASGKASVELVPTDEKPDTTSEIENVDYTKPEKQLNVKVRLVLKELLGCNVLTSVNSATSERLEFEKPTVSDNQGNFSDAASSSKENKKSTIRTT